MINYADPDIFITEGTIKDILITDGTVTVDGTDYEVTDDTITFTNADIESEAFELSQSLCSAGQLTIGACEAAQLKFRARKNINIDIRGIEVVLYIIPDGDASKMLQLGVFKIAEDVQSDEHIRHAITAYDAMYDILNKDVTDWYDTILQDEEATCYMDDFRDTFLNQFGVDAETVTLINDGLILRRTIEKDRISGAEIIKAICEINGCFGMITNEGKFRFKSLAPSIASAADLGHITTSQYSDIEFAEHGFKAIKKVKIIRDNQTIVTSSQTATGAYNTVTIAYNPLIADYNEAELQTVANTLCDALKGHIYIPCTVNAIGNPLHEVGDPIHIATKYNFDILTYILERRLRGIQALRDAYTANGEEYLSENLNSSYTQSKAVDSAISQMSQGGGGGVSSFDFPEIIRNIGFRLLDEPSGVTAEYDEINNEVSLKWTDPSDIATNEPCPATWAGTVVVRNEYRAPLHRWDGTEIEDSTTRDEYSVNALVDNTIQQGHGYYYGIFPYDTKGDYRYTKVVNVGATEIPVPQIDSLIASVTSILVNYAVASAYTYDYITLVYKKNSAPANKTDGTAVNLSASDTTVTITGLDEQTTYYLKIFAHVQDAAGELESNVENIKTGAWRYVTYTLEELAKTLDFAHELDYKATSEGETLLTDVPAEYYGTSIIILTGQRNGTSVDYDRENEMIYAFAPTVNEDVFADTHIPIKHNIVTNVSFDYKCYLNHSANVSLYKINGNTVSRTVIFSIPGSSEFETDAYRQGSANINLSDLESDYFSISKGYSWHQDVHQIEMTNIRITVKEEVLNGT